MRNFQWCLLVQQNIDLYPNAVSGMIRTDGFIAIDERREPPCEEGDFVVHPIVNCCASQAEDVFETCFGPIVDDEQGKQSSAEGVKPPDVRCVADCWKD